MNPFIAWLHSLGFHGSWNVRPYMSNYHFICERCKVLMHNHGGSCRVSVPTILPTGQTPRGGMHPPKGGSGGSR